MAKRFITPFAEAGDRATMPDTPTGTDSNYQTGYPSQYEEDPVVNPATAKFVERDKSNQLYNDITANIKEWQEQTYPAFITSAVNGGIPFSYKKNSIVTYLGVNYASSVDGNEDVPPSVKWEVYNTSLINNLSQEYSFETVADYKASPIIFPIGKEIKLRDRRAVFTVLAGKTTANDYSIIASTGLDYSIKLVPSTSSIIPAFHWGAVEGIQDDVLIKLLITESQATGKDVFYGKGNYDFNGLNIDNGGLSHGQDLGAGRFIGIDGGTNFKNIGSFHLSGFVKLHKINFIDCIQPTYMTGNISDMDIFKVTYTGCRRSIYHNDDTAGVKVSGGWIRHVEINSHIEDDFVAGILLNKAPFVDDVLIEHIKINGVQSDAAGTSIFSGVMVGNDNHPASNFNRNKTNNITILDCGQATATYKNPSFGIVTIGLDSEQDNNIIRNGKWLEAMYMKGDGNSQSGNKCHNNQHSGITMKIMLDTQASKYNRQSNNLVTGQCDIKPGQRCFGDAQSEGNKVDIFITGQVQSEGGYGYQCTRSSTIDGTLTIKGIFKSPKGISVTTAGNVDIDAEVTSFGVGAGLGVGVVVLKSTDGELGTVSVSGSIDSIDQALNVNWCKKFESRGLDIVCDRHAGDSTFIQAKEFCDMSKVDVHVTAVNSPASPVSGYAVSLYGETSSTSPITHLMPRSFKTDRNISVAPFRFVNLSAADMSIYANECVLGMNGNTALYVARTLTNLHIVNFEGLILDLTLANDITSKTLEADGFTVDKFLVNNGIIDTTYNATDVLANHTNATVTTSRVGNNKTA